MATNYKSSLSRYRKYLTAVSSQPLWQASLLLIFSLVLVITLLLFVLRPTLITISTLLGQIDTQRQTELQLDEKIAAVQKAQQLLNSIQPRLVYLENGLPDSAHLGTWAEAVETIASASGITVSTITLSDIPLAQATTSAALFNLSKINFEIEAMASYPQLVSFVETLENLPRLAIVESVRFNQQSDGQVELTTTGTINFIYAQKDN